MQHDPVLLFIVGVLYSSIVWLILIQVEVRFRIYARMKCRVGFHKRTQDKLGKAVRQYRCVYCNKPKSHPHLVSIQGGKKDIDTKFR